MYPMVGDQVVMHFRDGEQRFGVIQKVRNVCGSSRGIAQFVEVVPITGSDGTLNGSIYSFQFIPRHQDNAPKDGGWCELTEAWEAVRRMAGEATTHNAGAKMAVDACAPMPTPSPD